MLVKIGEVAAQYEISNRTLRYWEEAGILTSIRMENGYRYYDEANMMRVRQIMMLRRLRLPIQYIQSIFVSDELSYAIEVLRRHLEETRQEEKELKALGVVVEHLINQMKSQNNLSDMLMSLDVPDDNAILEFKNALQITLSERDSNMLTNSSYDKIGYVRIIKLPRMIFACYRAESETPEQDCAKVLNKFIDEKSLNERYGFRHFGFNNPAPQPGSPMYGYEMWAVIPEDMPVPEPLYKKEFKGGLFAAIPTELTNIGERWNQLDNWVVNNDKYEYDWNPQQDRRCLEECIDYVSFNSPETEDGNRQLDLLAPIKQKGSNRS